VRAPQEFLRLPSGTQHEQKREIIFKILPGIEPKEPLDSIQENSDQIYNYIGQKIIFTGFKVVFENIKKCNAKKGAGETSPLMQWRHGPGLPPYHPR
jgi:hypothetical protein